MKCHDYIRNPKKDGYRGIHIIGRYDPRLASRDFWHGQRIEIQLRSRLQHAFATAVETVTTFTQEPLKFGAGPIEWRRFFSLMGSALALREETALIPETPSNHFDLIAELQECVSKLNIRRRLRGWTTALTVMRAKHIKKFKWLLLVLDTQKETFRVVGYKDRKEASAALAEIEKSKSNRHLDAVLVWVSSVRQLRAAYPNYYADTKGFLEALVTCPHFWSSHKLALGVWF